MVHDRARQTLTCLPNPPQHSRCFPGSPHCRLLKPAGDLLVRRSCIRAAARLVERFKLADLQSYLTQFPPSHYSQGGKEPLLYATVLLLSLQFRGVVTFLAKDPSARSYRIDAPHFAIAFMHHKVHAGHVATWSTAGAPPLGRGPQPIWACRRWMSVAQCPRQ